MRPPKLQRSSAMSSLILAGLGIAGAALTARLVVNSMRQLQKHAAQLPKSPLFTSYYKGGFDPKMSRREAGLILGEGVRILQHKLPSLELRRELNGSHGAVRVLVLDHVD